MRSLQDLRYDLANRAETTLTTNLPGLWKAISRHPKLHSTVSGALVNRTILKIPTRPNPLSTQGDYTSWAALTDRTWDSRHLPAAEDGGAKPAPEVVDGFLRSERPYPDPKTGKPTRDPAKNESNHEIDLIQIYGLNAAVTDELRAHEGGLLQSQVLNGEEYPPYLYDGDR